MFERTGSDWPSMVEYATNPHLYTDWTPTDKEKQLAGVNLNPFSRLYPRRPAYIWRMRDLITFISLLKKKEIHWHQDEWASAVICIGQIRVSPPPPTTAKRYLECYAYREYMLTNGYWHIGTRVEIAARAAREGFDFSSDIADARKKHVLGAALDGMANHLKENHNEQ